MQAHQLSSLRRVMVLMAVATFAVIAMAACGGDDNDAPAADATPTQAPAEPTATATPAEPTATSMPEPPAAPMIPATVPEPGSDESQIMAVLEKQVIAINTADYESYLETCIPGAKRTLSVTQLKFLYEERRGLIGGDPHGTMNFSPQGYNVRDVEVKLLRAPFAQANFKLFDYDKQVGAIEYGEDLTVSRGFMKVEGKWYSETAPCGQI